MDGQSNSFFSLLYKPEDLSLFTAESSMDSESLLEPMGLDFPRELQYAYKIWSGEDMGKREW